MNWGQFKQEVDEVLLKKLGAGFDENSVEVDWIDVGFDVNEIEILTHEDRHNLRVT